MVSKFKQALASAIESYEDRFSGSVCGPIRSGGGMPAHRRIDVMNIKNDINRISDDVELRRRLIRYIDLHMQSGFTLFSHNFNKGGGVLIRNLNGVLDHPEFSESELILARQVAVGLSFSFEESGASGEELKDIIIDKLHVKIDRLETKLSDERIKSGQLFSQVRKLSRTNSYGQGGNPNAMFTAKRPVLCEQCRSPVEPMASESSAGPSPVPVNAM